MVEEFVDVGEGEGKKECTGKVTAEDKAKAKSTSPSETVKTHRSCTAFYKEHGSPTAADAVEENEPQAASESTPARPASARCRPAATHDFLTSLTWQESCDGCPEATRYY